MGYKQDLKNEPFNVCVIAYPGTAQLHFRAGKSCLINRFMSQESYCDDHLSVLSLAEFDSEVVGGTHWLYWGERSIKRDEGQGSRLRIIEHCEFLDDHLFAPIRMSQTYLERCLARNITVSSRKLAYVCKDQIGRETAYPKHYLDRGTYSVSAFVYVYDITLCGESASNQAYFLRSVLKKLTTDNIPLVLITSKHDVGSSDTARSLLGMILGEVNKRWIQRMLFLVETSAKLNVNITTAFLCASVLASHGIIPKKKGEGHSAISRLNQRIRMFSLQSKKESNFNATLLKLHFHEYTPSTLVYGTPSCLLTSYELPAYLPRSLKKDSTVVNESAASQLSLGQRSSSAHSIVASTCPAPLPTPTPPPLLMAALAKHPSHLDLGRASIPSAFFTTSPQNHDTPSSSSLTRSPWISKLLRICIVGSCQELVAMVTASFRTACPLDLCNCSKEGCMHRVWIFAHPLNLPQSPGTAFPSTDNCSAAVLSTIAPLYNWASCAGNFECLTHQSGTRSLRSVPSDGQLVTKSAFSVPPEGCIRNVSSASVFNSLPEAGSSQHACLQQAFRIFVYNRIDQLNGAVATVNLLLLWLDLSEVSRVDTVMTVSSGFALTSKLKIPLVSASPVHSLQVIRLLLDREDARSPFALSHTDRSSSSGYPTATFMDWSACPTSAIGTIGLTACLSTIENRSDVSVAVALVRLGRAQATQLPPNSSRSASDEQNNEPLRLSVHSVPPASGTARTLAKGDSSDPWSPTFVFLVRDQLHELLRQQTLAGMPSLDSSGCITVIHYLATSWPDIREPVEKCLSVFACKSAGQQRWTEARLNCSALVFVSLHAEQTGYQASAELAQQAKEDLGSLAQANGCPFFVLHSCSHGGGGADVLWQPFPSSGDTRKCNSCILHPPSGVHPVEEEEGIKEGWIGFVSLPTWDGRLTAAHRRLLAGDPCLTRRAWVGCDTTNGQVTPGWSHLGAPPAPPGGVRSCQKVTCSLCPVHVPGTTTTAVPSDQRPVVAAPHSKESFSSTYLAINTNSLMSQCPPGVGNTVNFPIVPTDNGTARNRIVVSPCQGRDLPTADRTRASSVAVPSKSPAANEFGVTKRLCDCSHPGVGKPESIDEEYYAELPITNKQSLGAGLLTTHSAGRHTRPKRPQLHSLSSSSSSPSSTCSSAGQGEVGGDSPSGQTLSQSPRVLTASSPEEAECGGRSAPAFRPTAADRVSESGTSVYTEVDDSLVSNASPGPAPDNNVPLALVACPQASRPAGVGLNLPHNNNNRQQHCTHHLLANAQCPCWLSAVPGEDGHLARASLNGQLPYRFSPRGCVLPPLPAQAPPPSSLVHYSTTSSSRRRRSADVMCCPACNCPRRQQQQLAWCRPSAISSLLRYIPSRPVVGAGETRLFGEPSRHANNCMEPVPSAHPRPLPNHSSGNGGTGSSALETIGNAFRRQGAWFRNSFLTRRNRRQS